VIVGEVERLCGGNERIFTSILFLSTTKQRNVRTDAKSVQTMKRDDI